MYKSFWLFGFLLGLLTCALAFPVTSQADSVIFSNFASSGFAYDPFVGLVGPSGFVPSTGFPGDVAVPFTPTSDADLSQILLPLLWESGWPPNSTTIELVNSSNGLPGTTVLESWPSLVLPYLSLSPPLTLTSSPGVFLAGGTQYWIVAQTEGTDFWSENDIGELNTFAFSHGADWSIAPNAGIFPGLAYEVTGPDCIS